MYFPKGSSARSLHALVSGLSFDLSCTSLWEPLEKESDLTEWPLRTQWLFKPLFSPSDIYIFLISSAFWTIEGQWESLILCEMLLSTAASIAGCASGDHQALQLPFRELSSKLGRFCGWFWGWFFWRLQVWLIKPLLLFSTFQVILVH